MWCVGVSVVLVGCLAQIGLGQPQAGVPLPVPSGVPQQSAQGPLPHVPLEAGGVPLPKNVGGHPANLGGPGILPQGGVPLPTPTGGHVATTGPAGGFGVPLPTPTGGHVGGAGPVGGFGVPLPPSVGVQDPALVDVPGGIRSVHDPAQDPDVRRILGLHAIRAHLQKNIRANTAVKISDIITAHKQVVAGQLVYLTLRVGETRCPQNTPDLTACAFDPTEDQHICEIVVWERPWLNMTKVVDEKSRCAETESDNDFNAWSVAALPRTTPTEQEVTSLPHGISRQQLAIEAFNYIDHGSESKFRGELVNFEIGRITFDPFENTTKVQVNVEYGFNLCLRSPDEKTDPRQCPRDLRRDNYVCAVTVVHNPNQITTLDVIPFLEDDDDIRCQRKHSSDDLVVNVMGKCVGCPQTAALHDPAILEIADFALKEYDRASNDDDLHMILRLVKAHTQVVSGIKYYLTIELAETHCNKRRTGVDVNRTFCAQDVTEETKLCDLHVLDQPWVPSRDLVAARCYDKHDYRDSDDFIVPVLLGSGPGTAAPTTFRTGSASTPTPAPLEITPQTQRAAVMVAAEYNRREDDHEFYKFVKMHEASVQQNSIHVAVELAETNCHKQDPTLGNGEHCLIRPSDDHEVCAADLVVQPTGEFTMVSFHCDDLDDYLRKMLMPHLASFSLVHQPFLQLGGRSSIPGATRVPANDSRVARAAHYVVDQYNLRGDDDELFVMTQIISANMQEGSKLLLEVEVAETHCKKYLPIADPSRCVIDHGEDREICQAEVMLPSAPGQDMTLSRLYCDERDDYYVTKIRDKLSDKPAFRSGAVGGQWVEADVNDKGLTKYGIRIADEFDLRSDEDNLFIFHKVLKAQKQVQHGLRYHLMVELVETICPKYKRRINKARCAPDIGEDHMICEAKVLVQPWQHTELVSEMHCTEKDDYHEGLDSLELTFPSVHPTAHARPVFRTQFVVRDSIESEESNERFYQASGRRNVHRHDSDEDDSDELPRFRRGIPGGFSPADPQDMARAEELAQFAVNHINQLSDDTYTRAVEEVVSVEKQVVAGLNWKLTVKVYWTTCTNGDQTDPSTCERDTERPSSICNITVFDQVWTQTLRVTESKCSPVTGKTAL